jgi:hypothetical protein
MPKGRPGGNPDIVNFSWKTDRPESCLAKMTLRLPESHYSRLRELDNWQEKVRDAIAHLLETETELEQAQLDGALLPGADRAGTFEPTTTDGGQTPATRNRNRTQKNQTGDTQTKGKRKGSPSARTETGKAL